MIRLVLNDHDGVSRWVSELLGHEIDGKAIGITQDQEPIAGIVYNGHWKGEINSGIEMTVAASHPMWAQRFVLRAAFAYPFELLGVRRVQARIRRRNKRARKLVEGLGFVYEGMCRAGHPTGGDAAMYAMLQKDCRWLDGGKKCRSAAPASLQ
jgi:RimJ/RimL family protein N-acetyltransferase